MRSMSEAASPLSPAAASAAAGPTSGSRRTSRRGAGARGVPRGRAAPSSRGGPVRRLGRPYAHSTSRWRVMHGDEAVRVWRDASGPAPTACTVSPRPTWSTCRASMCVGIVLAGGMRVRPAGMHRFGPGDVAPGTRRAPRGTSVALGALAGAPDRARAARRARARPRSRGRRRRRGFGVAAGARPRLARAHPRLHAALERPAWRLERDTLLQEWLCALARAGTWPRRARGARGATRPCGARASCSATTSRATWRSPRSPRAAGVSRHRLTRLFRAAYGLPPHRFVLAEPSGPPGGCSSAARRPPRSPRRPASSTRATCTATSRAPSG